MNFTPIKRAAVALFVVAAITMVKLYSDGPIACRAMTAPVSQSDIVDTKRGAYGSVVLLSDLIPLKGDVLAAYQNLIAAHDMVIIKCSAHWCGPCKKIAPVFADLAKIQTSVLFIEIDGEAFEALVKALGIRGYPTFITYKKGLQQVRWSGADRQQLRSNIAALVSK